MERKKLSELKCGEKGKILSLNGDSDFCRRLRSMGIAENAPVRYVLESPFGDPAAYESQGLLIAVRRRDGALIEVEPWD